MINFSSSYLDTPPVSGRIFDLLGAATATRETVLFFVHGGGWSGGSRTDFHPIALAYCQKGFSCVTAGYRLRKPGLTVFDQAQDLRDAMQAYTEAQPLKKSTLVLIGTSAGAHLALLAALAPPAKEVLPSYRIAGICVQATPFSFEPWPDIFPAIWDSMQSAVGVPYAERPALYREASPIDHISESTPPILALHAEKEHMFPLSLTDQFVARATAHGVHAEFRIYPNTEHGFFYSLDRWQQKKAFEDIGEFVDRVSPD